MSVSNHDDNPSVTTIQRSPTPMCCAPAIIQFVPAAICESYICIDENLQIRNDAANAIITTICGNIRDKMLMIRLLFIDVCPDAL